MVKFVILEQLENAVPSILTTPLPITTLVNAIQSRNALYPILDTESEIFIFVSIDPLS